MTNLDSLVNDYGDVDIRAGVPAGWKIIPGMTGSISSRAAERAEFWDWIEREGITYYRALTGFEHIEAEYFSTAHFSKPAHWQPVIEIIIPIVDMPVGG